MMNRIRFSKYLLAILLIIWTTVGCKTKEIQLDQKFSAGVVYSYIINKEVEDSRDSLGPQQLQTQAEFIVTSISNGHKTCLWRYGHSIYSGLDSNRIPEVVKARINYNNGLEVRFLVDEKGAFKKLLNLEECHNFLAVRYLAIFGEIGTAAKRQEVMDKIIEPIFRTQEVFMSSFCKEIVLLLSPPNGPLKLDKPTMQDATSFNPFGSGSEMPAKYTSTLIRIKENEATISVERIIGKEGMDSLMASAERMITSLNGHPSEDSVLPKMSYSSKGQIFYNRKLKLIDQVTNLTILKMDEAIKKERLEVTLTAIDPAVKTIK